MTTQCDIKRSFGEDWPWFNEVSQTKERNIMVQGKYTCYPISSYSQLDMMHDNEVQEQAAQKAKEWASGNHGARMLGGNMAFLGEVEKDLAAFQQKERCMIMSSGYLACMSAVATLADKNTVIIADKLIHACLNSGIKISNAKVVKFSHNNMQEAERLMRKHAGKKMVMVIESLQSMDGDIGDLPKARELCNRQGAILLMDEAHGLGAIGKTGRGALEHYGMLDQPHMNADVIVGTFSKSLSSVGGYICATNQIIEQFEFFAQGNMFSAGISAQCAAAAQKSLQILLRNPSLVAQLRDISSYFRNALNNAVWKESTPEKMKFKVGGIDGQPILPVIFYLDPIRLTAMAAGMKKEGFFVAPVMYPACSAKEPRFRICANSSLDRDTVDRFVISIVKVAESTPFKNPELLSLV